MPAFRSPGVPLLSLASLLLGLLASSATAGGASPAAEPTRVRIETTLGDIVVELDRRRAPNTTENFLRYVDDGFYDGTIFHRVIEGFMIQGGGFTDGFARKRTRAPIVNEANNGRSNRRYTISMARTTAPHSATSQFFINTVDNPNLDHSAATPRGWGYTVFGQVVEGQEVVDRISRVATGPGGPFSQDAPREPVAIVEVRRVAAAALEDVPLSDEGQPATIPAPAGAVPDESRGEPHGDQTAFGEAALTG